MRDGNIFDQLLQSDGGQSNSLLTMLFPDKYSMKIQTSEVQPDLTFPLACMDLFRKRWKSQALTQFGTSFYEHLNAKDRKARTALEEMGMAGSRSSSVDEDA